MHPLGMTRSRVCRNHAFIAPDSHVEAPLPGWTGSHGIILISPGMGHGSSPGFSQYLAMMEPNGVAGEPLPGVERFVFVRRGRIQAWIEPRSEASAGDPDTAELTAGAYLYLPPDQPHRLRAVEGSALVIFERRYLPLAGVEEPRAFAAHQNECRSEAFLGDPDAQLKPLLPDEPAFDMAVNLFTFQPGAALPFVEVHVMEHGLLLLEGQGVYRLAESWYPIQGGDAIWMAPYCPQWFAAFGREPATYLYYKDVHRDPLEAAE